MPLTWDEELGKKTSRWRGERRMVSRGSQPPYELLQ